MGKTGKSRRTHTLKVSTQRSVAFGKDPDHDDRFFQTLFCDPWQIWDDRRATRQLRTHVVWGMARQTVAERLREQKFNPPELDKLTDRLADFVLPACFINSTVKGNRALLPNRIKQAKESNTRLRELSRIEQGAKNRGANAILQDVDKLWPRDPRTGERAKPVSIIEIRRVAQTLMKRLVARSGSSHRPQVDAFTRAAYDELRQVHGCSKFKTTRIIHRIEVCLGIADSFNKSNRVDAILKRVARGGHSSK